VRLNHDAGRTVADVKPRKPGLNFLHTLEAWARNRKFQAFLPTNQLTKVPIMFSHWQMATGRQFDLPYLVEQWDDTDSHVDELIALVGDYRVARAAFEEAVKRRPGRIVTLRQKTRLLADSRSGQK
jgi:hypothetical protein